MSTLHREKEMSYEDSWNESFSERTFGKMLIHILKVIIEIIA